MSDDPSIAAIAARHGLSVGAVQALAAALAAGRGHAQWSHPDLGGMGQWSGGGMLQIGDMFNDGLKARVAAALQDLAAQAPAPSLPAEDAGPAATPRDRWWPDGLGEPASTGSQNAMRYACFPDKRRLAVEQDGAVRLYDTGRYRLTGFSQSQGDGRTLEFSGPDGAVTLDDLTPLPHG